MAYKALPPAHVLRQLVDYNPETGELFWKYRDPDFLASADYQISEAALKRFNRHHVGRPAFAGVHPVWGNKFGGFMGENFEANRVAWAIAYGEDPIIQVDHINGDPGDNRLVNLRKATGGQNCANRRSRKGSSSKFLGVDWAGNGWRAQIKPIGEKPLYLGKFETEVEAAKAYDAAAIRLHGEFARPNFARTG